MPDTEVATAALDVVVSVPRFTCVRSTAGGAVRVSVGGELDVATEPEFDRVLRRAQADAALVILDLRELEFMACSSAHLLLAAERRARQSCGRLVVVRGPAHVDRLFELTGIEFELGLADYPPERLPLPRSWRSVAA